jgi:protein-tyrosine phosphatase
MNCAAGKDRTGWAIAMTLLAVGADLDDVTDEFLLSNRMAPPEGLDPETATLMEPLTGVRAEYLHAGFAAVSAQWSSMDHYLEDALQVDDELRAQLLRALVEHDGV